MPGQWQDAVSARETIHKVLQYIRRYWVYLILSLLLAVVIPSARLEGEVVVGHAVAHQQQVVRLAPENFCFALQRLQTAHGLRREKFRFAGEAPAVR